MPAHTGLRFKLTSTNAIDYLRDRKVLGGDEQADARQLAGGVSNQVILVSRARGEDIVLKQVRDRLDVPDEWFCSIERVWREIETLRQCGRILGGERFNTSFIVEVPRLLFEDRANYLYGMSAAPEEHVVWKSELLSGMARTEIAAACGAALGTLHGRSWHDDSLAAQFDDRQFFHDLRLDPYYRQVARVCPDLSTRLVRLIESVWHERHGLVHGDFSPKNLLVHTNRVMLIDFEVGHYGDPAFDLGFFLTHLLFKACYHAPRHVPYLELVDAFHASYSAAIVPLLPAKDFDSLIARSIQNLGGCALARLVGKSKIEYLTDHHRRDIVFELGSRILTDQPPAWAAMRELVDRALKSIRK